MKALFTILLLLVCLSSFSQTIYYVKSAGNDNNDGKSWANAFKTLQTALATGGVNGDQIWVAAGTYYPDEGEGQTDNDRSSSFYLKNGVAIYGGFAGNEQNLADRNWKTNVTILSGDIDENDATSGKGSNSYHVVINFFNGIAIDNTAVLDGFTITAGNANGSSSSAYKGGGMYNFGSSPTLTNCSFSGNNALSGGGIFNDLVSSPTLTNCTFSDNSSGSSGGGMFNGNSCSPSLTNCSFSGNTAGLGGGISNEAGSSSTLTNCSFSGNTADLGGGIYNDGFSPTLTNCSFSGNTASAFGGGIYDKSSPSILTNCILWGDTGGEIRGYPATVTYSIVQDASLTTDGNRDQDPLFVDASNDNLRLKSCSPLLTGAMTRLTVLLLTLMAIHER